MRPASFDYVRAGSVEEAVSALASAGENARVLAGGQYLAIELRARITQPALVVDISRLADLRYIRAENDHLAVGALTRMADLEGSEIVESSCAALTEAVGVIADPQVRNRATVGGNLLLPPPGGDLAPVLLASDGLAIVVGPEGRREVSAEDLVASPPSGAELIVEVRFRRPGAASAFEKLSRRFADASLACAAAFVRLDDGHLSDVGLALGAVDTKPSRVGDVFTLQAHPLRAHEVEDRMRGRPFDAGEAQEALQDFCRGLDPPWTVQAEPDYRRAAAAVVALRALRRAVDRASGR